MSEHILFPAYCSATKKKFFVAGEVRDGIVVWNHGFFPGKGPQQQGSTPSPEPRSIRGHDLSRFVCPGCGYRASNAGGFSHWHCATCNELHCMGTAQGKHHGACGKCVHDTDAFRRVEAAPLAAVNDAMRGDYPTRLV